MHDPSSLILPEWILPFLSDSVNFTVPFPSVGSLRIEGSVNHTWPFDMAADSTSLSYWLNITFFHCALIIFVPMFLASFLIWKYEGFNKPKPDREEDQPAKVGYLYKDEAWRTCLKTIHPKWLLGYRLFSFVVLGSLLIANIVLDGAGIFYFYTQWTFALVTTYFGIGLSMSIYGCFINHKAAGDTADNGNLDTERGNYMAVSLEEHIPKASNSNQKYLIRNSAGLWVFIFQIIYQTSAGAVMLTDAVFWLILYPFLTSKDYRLNPLDVCLHSINAFFLLGDVILNCLRFPMFRFAYFVLWTGLYVVFQWIFHACVSIRWPYPFLDLSSSYAPLWYLGVAVMHIPCYGIFALIIRLKHVLLLRWFPESHQSPK
ncbi:uncharacterized protein LOC104433523 isoform X1 [Eucalyptus grandis]|uniref:Uncharacterized protein n=3 Tax=Eucalyptus grandis TaxID=71139 RepID=A0ACC3LWT7_EUCGR|nr:uncharacterized protein LOC104433523 isoform X1 [Eucalyptus grandis]KAK3443170.1 hypothetical protein EUGRSUZ_B03308 [Eucalyptus grandis]